MHPESDSGDAVRLDKWLWAARFFKTRSLAKQAIESGHVRCEGERAKVARSVSIGARLRIRQGWDEVEVIVRGVSGERRGAPEAQRLYEETSESRERRDRERLQRQSAQGLVSPERPTKQQRRALHRFKRGG